MAKIRIEDKLKNVQSEWRLLKNDQELWDVVERIKKYIEISHSRCHANNQVIPYLYVKTREKQVRHLVL